MVGYDIPYSDEPEITKLYEDVMQMYLERSGNPDIQSVNTLVRVYNSLAPLRREIEVIQPYLEFLVYMAENPQTTLH